MSQIGLQHQPVHRAGTAIRLDWDGLQHPPAGAVTGGRLDQARLHSKIVDAEVSRIMLAWGQARARFMSPRGSDRAWVAWLGTWGPPAWSGAEFMSPRDRDPVWLRLPSPGPGAYLLGGCRLCEPWGWEFPWGSGPRAHLWEGVQGSQASGVGNSHGLKSPSSDLQDSL